MRQSTNARASTEILAPSYPHALGMQCLFNFAQNKRRCTALAITYRDILQMEWSLLYEEWRKKYSEACRAERLGDLANSGIMAPAECESARDKNQERLVVKDNVEE